MRYFNSHVTHTRYRQFKMARLADQVAWFICCIYSLDYLVVTWIIHRAVEQIEVLIYLPLWIIMISRGFCVIQINYTGDYSIWCAAQSDCNYHWALWSTFMFLWTSYLLIYLFFALLLEFVLFVLGLLSTTTSCFVFGNAYIMLHKFI